MTNCNLFWMLKGQVICIPFHMDQTSCYERPNMYIRSVGKQRNALHENSIDSYKNTILTFGVIVIRSSLKQYRNEYSFIQFHATCIKSLYAVYFHGLHRYSHSKFVRKSQGEQFQVSFVLLIRIYSIGLHPPRKYQRTSGLHYK